MAEEVGAAFVSLIPSARGFSALAKRELKKELAGNAIAIPVKPEVDTRNLAPVRIPAILDVDRTQLAQGGRIKVPAEVDGSQLRRETTSAIRGVEATRPTVRVGVDVDKPLLGRLFGGLFGGGSSTSKTIERDGKNLGITLAGSTLSSFGTALSDGASTPMKGLANNPAISTIGGVVGLGIAVAAGPVIATALSAAISAALIGGAGLGVIGLGAWLLKDQPDVNVAAKNLMFTAQSVFQSAAIPLIQPFVQSLGILRSLLVELSPQLREMFAAIAPAIVPLTQGLAGFIREALPGFIALIRAAVPFFQDLESTLPRLGSDIGTFFGFISGAGPGASQFFRDFLKLLGATIAIAGLLIAVFTQWYLNVRTVITGVASLVAGIGGRIKSAVGDLGSLLYQAGRNVIQGLIDGITSKFQSLGSIMSQAAQFVRDHWPFSPAKTGPLSGSGSLFYAGQHLATDVASGMASKLPVVASASNQLAGAVGIASRSGTSMAAAGGTLAWRDDATGDPLLDALRELITGRFGGSVDAALAGR